MTPKLLVIGACAVAAVAAYFLLKTPAADHVAVSKPSDGNPMVAIKMPSIEGKAAIGERIFEGACASCHGVGGVGVEGMGPPLVHVIYEPSHHADESFQRAVAGGVRSHHWQFGDMPPIEGVTRGDVAMVIAYIREIQRANGIN